MKSKKIFWIGEIGSNFNQNYNRALRLIDKAKEIGCDAVKFQLFSAETLWHESYEKERKVVKERELPIKWIPMLYQYCHSNKINIGYSIFHWSFISPTEGFTDFLKISSWDILRIDLITKCLSTKLPLYISLGGASSIEIQNAIYYAPKEYPLTLLHCIPKYPATYEESNFGLIRTIQWNTPFKSGYSDHTTDPKAIYTAIELGTQTIEFHLDLKDRKGAETKYGHVWMPEKIEKIIKDPSIGKRFNSYHPWNFSHDFDDNIIQFKNERSMRADFEDGLRPTRSMRGE